MIFQFGLGFSLNLKQREDVAHMSSGSRPGPELNDSIRASIIMPSLKNRSPTFPPEKNTHDMVQLYIGENAL